MPAPRSAAPRSSRLQVLDSRAARGAPDNFASIQTYYRSADLQLRQAEAYRLKDNEEELYVMLMRFATMVIETLPQHRAFNKAAPGPKYLALKSALLSKYMPELERLRATIKLRDVAAQLGGDEHMFAFMPTKTAGAVRLAAGNLPEIHWEDGGGAAAQPATPAAPPPPAAGAALGVPQPEGFDLLAGLGGGPAAARQQQQQQAAAAMPSVLAISLPEVSSSLRLPTASQATLAKHALLPSVSFGSTAHPAELQQPPPALQPRSLYPELAELELPPPPPPPDAAAAAAAAAPPPAFDAALASLSLGGQQQQQQQPGAAPPWPTPSPYGELQLGPQEVGVTAAPRPTQPLPRGAACCPPDGAPGAVVPAPPPPSGGVAEVKKLQQIRDVHVSVALMDEFMRYAQSNTRRGIESCGILAGVLSPDDALFTITTLIVPKQTGTSDTVEMLNEEEIFEVQDSRGLYPLGWIHTHPTQTCFLSSVDIHTHCGFQTMLDEAVAIVMAPKDPSKRVGIFRLSTPGGLKLIQRCPQRGFHAHPPTDTGQPIYELCGHVYLNPRAAYEVVDLR